MTTGGGASRDPLARAMHVLGVLIDSGNPHVGVRELAALAGIPPSSAHRTLVHMEQLSLVQKNGDGQYSLGLEPMRWGQLLSEIFPVRRLALPYLRELVERSGETALLGLYNPQLGQMMYAASVESAQLLKYTIQLQEWRPIYAGASGQAILAFLPEEEQRRLLEDEPLRPLTDRTVLSVPDVYAALRVIRRDGVAITRGQSIPGAVGIAAPIFDHRVDVVGDVCVTVPAQRFEAHREDELVAEVTRCARAISQALGAIDSHQMWPPTKHLMKGTTR